MTDTGGVLGARQWDHTSITVSDLDAASAFYRKAFGFEVVLENRGITTEIESMVGIPGLASDLLQLRSPYSRHLLELISFHNGGDVHAHNRPISPGAAHVAFRLADFDRGVEHIQALGAEILGEVTRFSVGPAAYFRDPSGSFIELSQMR